MRWWPPGRGAAPSQQLGASVPWPGALVTGGTLGGHPSPLGPSSAPGPVRGALIGGGPVRVPGRGGVPPRSDRFRPPPRTVSRCMYGSGGFWPMGVWPCPATIPARSGEVEGRPIGRYVRVARIAGGVDSRPIEKMQVSVWIGGRSRRWPRRSGGRGRGRTAPGPARQVARRAPSRSAGLVGRPREPGDVGGCRFGGAAFGGLAPVQVERSHQ